MGSAPAGLRRRLAWFAGLYVASLGLFAALVYGLKALVRF
jgi:hypothetical protein